MYISVHFQVFSQVITEKLYKKLIIVRRELWIRQVFLWENFSYFLKLKFNNKIFDKLDDGDKIKLKFNFHIILRFKLESGNNSRGKGDKWD